MAFGDFTVVRSTVKNVLNSSGLLAQVAINTPAFEFNTDGSYKGLLVEPAGTNLFIRSQEFDNAAWTKDVGAVVTPNTDVAPNGQTTADTITPTASAISGIVRSVTTGTGAITMSVYARVVSGTKLFRFFRFNATDGVVASPNFTATTTWQRFTFTTSPTVATSSWYIVNASADTIPYFIWQAQLETGSVATSHITTVASTVTRTADSITLTGASSLIGQTEGTIFVECELRDFQATSALRIMQFFQSANNRVQITRSASTKSINAQFIANNVTTVSINTGVLTLANTVHKFGFAYQNTNSILATNGTLSTLNTGAISFTGTLVTIGLGNQFDGTLSFNGWLRSFTSFPTRLTNAQLQAITT